MSKQRSYQGLINQGSTCYLNSLLQTLYMTSQFRSHIYKIEHNPKKTSLQNSIPYQLQKLFYLLSTQNKPVISKGLLKSFQWTQADAFQQHDVQQFCRVLFQAIELADKKSHWVNQLFGGNVTSFITCDQGHTRQKQEMFLDLSLPVHDVRGNLQFHSLEQCIKQYLKPQKLQDKIDCQQCGQKALVQKGLKIHNLPPLLTIQLNRFQLNYQTWTRQKVNTFLYFPQMLYMGKFMKKYQQIQICQVPVGLKQKVRTVQKQKTSRTVNPYSIASQVPKIKPKRKASDEIASKVQKVFFPQQQIKINKEKQLSTQQQIQKNKQILAQLKTQKTQIGNKLNKIKQKSQQKQKQKSQQKQKYDLDDDILFGSGMGFISNHQNIWQSGTTLNDQKKPTFTNTQIHFQHEEQTFDPKKQYLQHTYMLYAVLVHSGGAYGGHYYAYISNGNEWFRFDDSTVRKVSKSEIRKYGAFDKSSHGANAYLLFYRDVNTHLQSNPDLIQIPSELSQKVKADLITNIQQVSKAQKRYKQIVQGVMLKTIISTAQCVIQQSSFQSLFIQDRHQQTISSLKVRLGSTYPQLQTIGVQNWRLRRYNKVQDTLHEVYDQAVEMISLENLGFRQTVYLAIETKLNHQKFITYDPKEIVVKVNHWRPNITLVTQKMLKPLRIIISQDASFTELVKIIQTKFKIQQPVILKRNFSQSNPIQIFSLQQIKKLIELRFFNGINLYIQQVLINKQSRWLQQFQSQRYRCLIKYNNPLISQNRDNELYFDTRKTLKQLKQKFSQLINVPFNQFRIKKSKQVSELTTFAKKLTDLKFINNQFVFLELGRSSFGSIIIKKATVHIIDDKIQFTTKQQTIIQIEQGMTTVGDILQKLSMISLIPVQKVRIREFKGYQFQQIFHASQSISRIKQKCLIWQQVGQAQPKGIQIYIRIFDMIKMELSQLKQIYVEQGATYQELSYIIEQELGIRFNKILGWKALSNFVEKSILIDCEWFELAYIRANIKEEPLFVGTDGDILIIKQAQNQYHPKLNYTQPSTNISRQKGKQASLKIRVVEQQQDLQLMAQIAKIDNAHNQQK